MMEKTNSLPGKHWLIVGAIVIMGMMLTGDLIASQEVQGGGANKAPSRGEPTVVLSEGSQGKLQQGDASLSDQPRSMGDKHPLSVTRGNSTPDMVVNKSQMRKASNQEPQHAIDIKTKRQAMSKQGSVDESASMPISKLQEKGSVQSFDLSNEKRSRPTADPINAYDVGNKQKVRQPGLNVQVAPQVKKPSDLNPDNPERTLGKTSSGPSISTWNVEDYSRISPETRLGNLGNVMPIVIENDRETVTINVDVDSWYYEASWAVYQYGVGYITDTYFFTYEYEMQSITLTLGAGDYSVDCWDTFGDGGIAGYTTGATNNASWGAYDYVDFGEFFFDVSGAGGSDAPIFFSVSAVNPVDNDGDGFYDYWDLEIDVDAASGGVAENVYFNIVDEFGVSRGDAIGPYTFVGYEVDDNVIMYGGDAAWYADLIAGDAYVVWSWTAYNDAGSDMYDQVIPVEHGAPADDDYPMFWNVYTVNTIDGDGDGYLEYWDLEIDIDASYGGVASDVYIDITDDEGNFWGTFGPFDFVGAEVDDNVTIYGWSMGDYGFASPQDVNFCFNAYNGYGADALCADVYVDGGEMGTYPMVTDSYVDWYSDADGDFYYDNWYLRVWLATSDGGIADDCYLNIYSGYGTYTTVGPFTLDGAGYIDIDMYPPAEIMSDENITYCAETYNPVGGNEFCLSIPVEGGDSYAYPCFYDVYTVNWVDTDGDGLFEYWEFEIDIDACGGEVAENVYISVTDDEGYDWGLFGPYSFVGWAIDDNALIWGWSSDWYDSAPRDVNFTFTAFNDYGTDYQDELVPVDGEAGPNDPPCIYTTYITNGVDNDGDGFFEYWDFEVDVDACNGNVATDVYLNVVDDFGYDRGTFGPYTFVGYNTDDNAILSGASADWYYDLLAGPDYVGFTVTATNAEGTDSQWTEVPVDLYESPSAYPYFWSVWPVDVYDDDGDGYWNSWGFEIDIDASNGEVAENVFVEIYDSWGWYWGTFGPYSFEGSSTMDNAIVTGWFSDYYGEYEDFYMYYDFYAYNDFGADEYTGVEVPVESYYDEPEESAPCIYDIYVINGVDEDGNGFYEYWDFEVDIDACDGDVANDVYINVVDEFGIDRGTLGPYTFVGYAVDDNAILTGGDPAWYDGLIAGPDFVNFTFEAYNELGNDFQDEDVPVDHAPPPFSVWVPEELSVNPGDVFMVPVETNGLLEEHNITAYQFTVGFDSEAIQYMGYNTSGTLSDDGLINDNPGEMPVALAFADDSPIFGDGTLLYLEFEALTAGAMSPIDLNDFLFNTTPINPGDGMVSIAYCILGDIDDDGEVMAYDASLTLQGAIGMEPPLPFDDRQLCAADVDCDGNIYAYDASLILQYAVGVIAEWPCEAMDRESRIASVDIRPEGNYLVLYASGDLTGLNLDLNDLSVLNLGAPELLLENAQVSTNISEGYRLGYMGLHAPAEGEAFMRIPYVLNGGQDEWNVDIQLVVNATELVYQLDLSTLGIADNDIHLPENVMLSNFPNPFNPSTSIVFAVTDAMSPVELSIYDIQGKLIRSLYSGTMAEGNHVVSWDGLDQNSNVLSSGQYFCIYEHASMRSVQKLMLMRQIVDFEVCTQVGATVKFMCSNLLPYTSDKSAIYIKR